VATRTGRRSVSGKRSLPMTWAVMMTSALTTPALYEADLKTLISGTEHGCIACGVQAGQRLTGCELPRWWTHLAIVPGLDIGEPTEGGDPQEGRGHCGGDHRAQYGLGPQSPNLRRDTWID
jgi:hypothetical protein